MELFILTHKLIQIPSFVPIADIRGCRISVIWDQVGTPQKPIDWSEPDKWIPERLKGEDEKLAFRIWNESNRKINPRYFENIYRFINSYELLAPDSMDTSKK